MSTIEKRVEEFCEWLSPDEDLSNNEDYKKMILQIKKYWQKDANYTGQYTIYKESG